MEKTRNLIGIDILKKNAWLNRYSDFSEGWFGSIQSPHLARHSQYLDRPRLYLALKHAEQSLKFWLWISLRTILLYLIRMFTYSYKRVSCIDRTVCIQTLVCNTGPVDRKRPLVWKSVQTNCMAKFWITDLMGCLLLRKLR